MVDRVDYILRDSLYYLILFLSGWQPSVGVVRFYRVRIRSSGGCFLPCWSFIVVGPGETNATFPVLLYRYRPGRLMARLGRCYTALGWLLDKCDSCELVGRGGAIGGNYAL